MGALLGTSLGMIKVGEALLPIQSIRLVPRGVEIIGIGRGPIRDAGWAQVFTAEGQPVTDPALPVNQGVYCAIDVREGSAACLTLSLMFDSIAGHQRLRISDR